jgi:hypothetical protein
MSDCSRLFAVLNVAMADTAFTIWSAKRYYGDIPTEVTWRPATAIWNTDYDRNPDTTSDLAWLPLVTTPSHPGIRQDIRRRTVQPRRCFSGTSPMRRCLR